MRRRRLGARDLPPTTKSLARALLGCVVVRVTPDGRTSGRIVECEAYLPGDEASHAYGGKTPRNASMFLAPLHAYVYKIYGTAFCFNVTSEAPDVGAAVLVRALEPLDGLPLMRRRRGVDAVRDLCRGPGRLCQAMSSDVGCNGLNLLSSTALWLESGEARKTRVGLSRRIGISRAADRRLRYYEVGNDFLSGARHLSP